MARSKKPNKIVYLTYSPDQKEFIKIYTSKERAKKEAKMYDDKLFSYTLVKEEK